MSTSARLVLDANGAPIGEPVIVAPDSRTLWGELRVPQRGSGGHDLLLSDSPTAFSIGSSTGNVVLFDDGVAPRVDTHDVTAGGDFANLAGELVEVPEVDGTGIDGTVRKTTLLPNGSFLVGVEAPDNNRSYLASFEQLTSLREARELSSWFSDVRAAGRYVCDPAAGLLDVDSGEPIESSTTCYAIASDGTLFGRAGTKSVPVIQPLEGDPIIIADVTHGDTCTHFCFHGISSAGLLIDSGFGSYYLYSWDGK